MTEIDMGTWPDWLAAIGTVGALFLGLGILRGDRRRQRREQAAHVAVWDSGGRVPLLSGDVVDRGSYTVTLHNQSQQPVTAPAVVARLLSPARLERRVGYRGIPCDWLDERSPLALMGDAGPTSLADSFKDDVGVSLSHIPPGAIVEHSIPLPLPRPCYDVAVTFRDAAGLPWKREVATGILEMAEQGSAHGIARWLTRARHSPDPD